MSMMDACGSAMQEHESEGAWVGGHVGHVVSCRRHSRELCTSEPVAAAGRRQQHGGVARWNHIQEAPGDGVAEPPCEPERGEEKDKDLSPRRAWRR